MRYISIPLAQVLAAKFVQPTMMFHGTSLNRAKSILSKGLGFSTKRITTAFEPLANAYLTPRVSEAINYIRKAIRSEGLFFDSGLLVVCSAILQDHSVSISDDELIGFIHKYKEENVQSIRSVLPKSIHRMFDKFIESNRDTIIELKSRFNDYGFDRKSFINDNKDALKKLGVELGRFVKYYDPFQRTTLDPDLRYSKNVSLDKQITTKGNPKIVAVIQVKFNPGINTNISLKMLWKKNFDKNLFESYLFGEQIIYNWE